MELKAVGRLRKLLESIDQGGVGDDEQLTLNQQLELLMAQGSGANEMLVGAGRAFWIGNTTAVAAVVAIPTTGVNLAVYNNASDGGRSMVIDWVAAQNVATTAVACQAQMLGLIGQVRETAPTDSGLVAKKRNGYGTGTVDSAARSIVGGTALPGTTGAAANWFPIGASGVKPGVTTTPGYGMYQRLEGDIIVPPGRYFALTVLANVVGETFVMFVGWHEKQISLG